MLQWIDESLVSGQLGITVIAAAFFLGIIGAVTSSCNLAFIGAIAGYSGVREQKKERSGILINASFFMIGTVISIAALGAVTGLISQTAGGILGRYWKLAAGFIIFFFGLAALGLVPFKLPKINVSSTLPKTNAHALLFGLTVGGGLAACSACCNPSLFVALGFAALQKQFFAGTIIMTSYAIGYGLPLTIMLAGIGAGLNRLPIAVDKLAQKIKIAAGILLLATGLYLLNTIGN